MARALARGWGRPLLCADPSAERAAQLAAEVGGEALASNAEVAARADLRRALPQARPARGGGRAKSRRAAQAVASILAATPLEALREAYPERAGLPLHPVAAGRGAPGRRRAGRGTRAPVRIDNDATLDAAVAELFAELGTLVVLDDALVDVAMGLMSCAPAYVALVAEAQVDAGVRRGIPAAQGAELVVQTLAGTAELLRRRDYDTVAVRREVASPGGLTARGVDALERGRAARGVQRRARRGARRRAVTLLATARTQIADYLSTLIYVYTLLIILYIVIQLLFSAGLRPPYSRASDAVLGFLRDVCEPFLRIFRRLLPSFGGIDFSPILAIIIAVHRQQRRRPGHHPRLSARCLERQPVHASVRASGRRRRWRSAAPPLASSRSRMAARRARVRGRDRARPAEQARGRTLDRPGRRTQIPAGGAARQHAQPRRRLRLPARQPPRRDDPDRPGAAGAARRTSRCTSTCR